jgi:hypothetical protein
MRRYRSQQAGRQLATFQASYIIEINMIYIDSLASCYKSQFTLNTTFAYKTLSHATCLQLDCVNQVQLA